MGCGCGGKGGGSYKGTRSKVYSPAKIPLTQTTPAPKGVINLPTPTVNDAVALRRIKDLNKQAVNRARGLS